MRITIDLPDHVLGEVEAGLRKAIEDPGSPSQFQLENASWGSGGSAAGYDWTVVRDLIYEAPLP
jgi:hypothetical protein